MKPEEVKKLIEIAIKPLKQRIEKLESWNQRYASKLFERKSNNNPYDLNSVAETFKRTKSKP